ncbi:MAG: phage holin [Syntrophomonas sp.]
MGENMLVNLAYGALSILVPALCAIVIELMRRKLGLENIKKVKHELDNKKELANLAVKFVEQAYKDIKGRDKFDKAAEWLASQAKEKGLQVTPEEIQGLIEAAIRMAKDEFGEQWGKAVTG